MEDTNILVDLNLPLTGRGFEENSPLGVGGWVLKNWIDVRGIRWYLQQSKMSL